MEDSDLVIRIRNGDESAWEELVDRHSGLLWRLARGCVDDDAAASDAMQTAWLRLLQHIDRLEEPGAVRGWLCTTVRREAIALSNARRRQRPDDVEDWSLQATPASQDPGEQSAASERRTTVLEALRRLSTRCQQLLSMFAHKISYNEIAATMDIAVGSIGPTKARCLEQLRRIPAIASLELAL